MSLFIYSYISFIIEISVQKKNQFVILNCAHENMYMNMCTGERLRYDSLSLVQGEVLKNKFDTSACDSSDSEE